MLGVNLTRRRVGLVGFASFYPPDVATWHGLPLVNPHADT